jgi:hypothetical protein
VTTSVYSEITELLRQIHIIRHQLARPAPGGAVQGSKKAFKANWEELLSAGSMKPQ